MTTVYRIEITIHRPWAVGTVATAGEVDQPILRARTEDGQVDAGPPYIPAASLVGSLRAHLMQDFAARFGPSAAEEQVVALFGGLPDADAKALPSGRELTALGTRLLAADGREPRTDFTVERITTTAVDSVTRTARDKALRVEDVVHASEAEPTRLEWFIESPGPLDTVLSKAIAAWRPVIGRRRGVGRGDARVTCVEAVEVDLDDPADLTWWLTERHDWYSGRRPGRKPEVVSAGGAEPEPLIDLEFEVVDALHVGSGERDEAAGFEQTKALQILRDGEKHPVVPGSSWRGVFRSRATYIAGLLGRPGWEEQIADLFGPEAEATSGAARQVAGGAGGGADRQADPPARGRWRGRLRFYDSAFAAETFVRTHVAIDRVTGGALEGALFSVEALPAGARSRLMIGWDGAEASIGAQEMNLLRWVIRDLQDGLIGIGGMAGRGYGTVRFLGDLPAPAPFEATAQAEPATPSAPTRPEPTEQEVRA